MPTRMNERSPIAVCFHSCNLWVSLDDAMVGQEPGAASPTASCFEIALGTPDVVAALARIVAGGGTPMG